MKAEFDTTPPEDFLTWYKEQIVGYDTENAAPWTHLGYTYNWAENGTELGLSELVIRAGAEVQVAFTDTTIEFVKRLENHAINAIYEDEECVA